MITIESPELIAFGKEMSAMAANRYAHHIVATPLVIFSASHKLNFFMPQR
jgi:hypothetical protein